MWEEITGANMHFISPQDCNLLGVVGGCGGPHNDLEYTFRSLSQGEPGFLFVNMASNETVKL